MEMIIGLISGAVGGNAAGGVLKNLNQGVLVNTLAGIVGGGLGSTILGAIGAGDMGAAAGAVGSFDIGTIISQFCAGGVGGGVILAIVGVIRNKMTG